MLSNKDQSFQFNHNTNIIGFLNFTSLSYILLASLFGFYFINNLDVEGIIIIDVFSIISIIYLLINKQVYLYTLSNKNILVSTVFNYFILLQQLCVNATLFVLQSKIEFFMWKHLTNNWLIFVFNNFHANKIILNSLFTNELSLFLNEQNKDFLFLKQTRLNLTEVILYLSLQIEYLALELSNETF